MFLLIAHLFLTELLSLIGETQRKATEGKASDGDKTAKVVMRSLKADKESTQRLRLYFFSLFS